MLKSFWLGMTGSLLICSCASAAEQRVRSASATDLGGSVGLETLAQADASTIPATAVSTPFLQPALQARGVYVTAAVGANWPTTVSSTETSNVIGDNYGYDEFHHGGLSVETGIGYDFGAIRAEATYAYDGSRTTGYSDSSGTYSYTNQANVSKNSLFASVYWDINLNSRFSPYIGAGIGYSRLSMSSSADAFGSYAGYGAGAFGYQAKAGLSYLINQRSEVFAEGIYRGMNGYSSRDGDVSYWHGNYNSWGFQLGGRIRFGRN